MIDQSGIVSSLWPILKRPVQLIPKFGRQIGSTFKAKQEMEKAELKNSNLETEGGSGKGPKFSKIDFILNYYEEFWLNHWTDRSLYQRIF